MVGLLHVDKLRLGAVTGRGYRCRHQSEGRMSIFNEPVCRKANIHRLATDLKSRPRHSRSAHSAQAQSPDSTGQK